VHEQLGPQPLHRGRPNTLGQGRFRPDSADSHRRGRVNPWALELLEPTRGKQELDAIGAERGDSPS
jgi:hypothetical protein